MMSQSTPLVHATTREPGEERAQKQTESCSNPLTPRKALPKSPQPPYPPHALALLPLLHALLPLPYLTSPFALDPPTQAILDPLLLKGPSLCHQRWAYVNACHARHAFLREHGTLDERLG